MNTQAILYKIRDIELRLIGAPTIHCMGDSHLGSFEYIDRKNFFRKTRFRFCIVQGATAMGIPNPASKTQAGPIFNEYLKKVSLEDHILTCMGEVDCGFVIWYRSKKYNEPISKQFSLAMSNYTDFLNRLRQEGRRNIIVCSAPLPTIKDGENWGEVASLRNEVKATLRERTDITLAFNCNLREYCCKNSITFLDFEKKIINARTNLIDDRFLNPNKLDHHINPEAMAEVISSELRNLGFS